MHADGTPATGRPVATTDNERRAAAPLRRQPVNYLAAELRSILDDLGDDPHNAVGIERVRRLAEHVERLGAEPVQVATTTTALTGSLRLEPDQQIHASALHSAAVLLGPALAEAELDQDAIATVWLALADLGAGLIADGSRP